MEFLERRFVNEEVEGTSLPEMIDDKLKEFNFYTAL